MDSYFSDRILRHRLPLLKNSLPSHVVLQRPKHPPEEFPLATTFGDLQAVLLIAGLDERVLEPSTGLAAVFVRIHSVQCGIHGDASEV